MGMAYSCSKNIDSGDIGTPTNVVPILPSNRSYISKFNRCEKKINIYS